MLMKASLLETLTVHATDAELGKVKDVYFDSKHWGIRYLVIDTRKWLPGKKVLVSPSLIDNVDILENTIVLKASKEQVENSPTPDAHETISRKVESELHSYYGLHPYWYGNGFVSGVTYNDEMPEPVETDIQKDVLDDEEVHLRSMDEFTGKINGYTIQAKDKDMGQVVDFMFDDESWTVQYFMVDTGDLLPGYKVFLPPELIKEVDVINKDILVDEPAKEIARKSGTIINEDNLSELAKNPVEEIAKDRKVI